MPLQTRRLAVSVGREYLRACFYNKIKTHSKREPSCCRPIQTQTLFWLVFFASVALGAASLVLHTNVSRVSTMNNMEFPDEKDTQELRSPNPETRKKAETQLLGIHDKYKAQWCIIISITSKLFSLLFRFLASISLNAG